MEKIKVLKAKEERKYLDKHELNVILKVIKKSKLRDQLLFHLMLDCGLRVSETINLRFSSINFKTKTIPLKGLKKRGKNEIRKVYLTSRVWDLLLRFINAEPVPKDEKGNQRIDCFVFPSRMNNRKENCDFDSSGRTHIKRTSVNKMFQRLVLRHSELHGIKLNPHRLRHTFATLGTRGGIEKDTLRLLLGHEHESTTDIYGKSDDDKVRQQIEKTLHLSPMDKLTRWFGFLMKRPQEIAITTLNEKFLVGRFSEVKSIDENLRKNINVVLTGDAGTGKKYLINCLDFQRPTLVFDDTKGLKNSILGCLVKLYKVETEKEALEIVTGARSENEFKTLITKKSVQNLIEFLISITKKNEYVLVIKDLEGVTPASIRYLSMLANHFVILTSIQKIPMKAVSFLSNFENIELKNLSRQNALNLVYKYLSGCWIEDYTFLKNRLWECSQGNPKMIFQLCDRLTKETKITNEIVNDICERHIGKVSREIDLSLFLLALAMVVFVLVWFKTGADRQLLRAGRYFIIILLLFGRSFFNGKKRKFL